MATKEDHIAMISTVAQAMGQELCSEVAFVGGCTTALLITDAYSQSQIRHTDDVDLIVHVISTAGWHNLIEKLRNRGFRESMIVNDDPICAMRLGELRVDFMPDDEQVLGFTNRWYKDAFRTAEMYTLPNDAKIRLLTPIYFIATKLEAYLQRGQDDPLGSRDIEDILTLIDGRSELLAEILQAPSAIKAYIATQFTLLLCHHDFQYAIQTATYGNRDRELELFDRIERIIKLSSAA